MSYVSASAAMRRSSEIPPACETSGCSHGDARLDDVDEIPSRVQALARGDREGGALRELADDVEVLGEHGLLDKEQVERLERRQEAPCHRLRPVPVDVERDVPVGPDRLAKRSEPDRRSPAHGKADPRRRPSAE